MSTRHAIPASQKAAILRFLAVDNLTVEATADEMALSYDATFDVARHHGYPDVSRMMWAIERLQDVADGDMDVPTPEAFEVATVDARRSTPERTPAASDAITALLSKAAKSDKKRTQNLGAKVSALIDDLREVLARESEAERQRAEREEQAKANARKIAELEAQIAALKGQRVVAPAKPKAKVATAPRGEFPCSGCDRVLDTVQGLNLHGRRAHGFAAVKAEQFRQVAS